jgi:hypothetical protein
VGSESPGGKGLGSLGLKGRRHPNFDLQLLVGISAESEEPMLFRFDGKRLHEADEFNFLGVGDSGLLRCLGAMMHSPESSTEKTIVAAAA